MAEVSFLDLKGNLLYLIKGSYGGDDNYIMLL